MEVLIAVDLLWDTKEQTVLENKCIYSLLSPKTNTVSLSPLRFSVRAQVMDLVCVIIDK